MRKEKGKFLQKGNNEQHSLQSSEEMKSSYFPLPAAFFK